MHLRPLTTLAGCLLLLGCAAPPASIPHARPYPEDIPAGPTIDIQVFPRATRLELTNTTARSFGPSTLWLNKAYSRPIDGLAVGQSLSIPLAEFRNEHGEPFRGGGFFATEPPDRLVLAQLETGPAGRRELLGLVVIAPPEP